MPVDFRHDLAAAGLVETAKYARLDHLSNGALLNAMIGRFDVPVTVDASLRYQQSIQGRAVAVLVVKARTNTLIDLRVHVTAILAALGHIRPGTVAEAP